MDTSRLRAALGKEFEEVVRYTTRAALEESAGR